MSRGYDGVYLALGAHVAADVTLAKDCGVWYNAVLRGDEAPITVGEGTNIQDCCVVHGDLGFPVAIGRLVTVGHGAILHGCTVGDGALIGMGATVLNGAKIGANAMVAAGSLVPSGMEVPDGMLAMGCPAKLKRPLTHEEIAANRANTELYIDLARKAMQE